MATRSRGLDLTEHSLPSASDQALPLDASSGHLASQPLNSRVADRAVVSISASGLRGAETRESGRLIAGNVQEPFSTSARGR
ncbi:MAG: hypothetical protein WCD11_04080 [Solirubrobacteraceae bacterium]